MSVIEGFSEKFILTELENKKDDKQELIETLQRSYQHSLDFKIFQYFNHETVSSCAEQNSESYIFQDIKQSNIPALQDKIELFSKIMTDKLKKQLTELYLQYNRLSYNIFESMIIPTYELYNDELDFLLKRKLEKIINDILHEQENEKQTYTVVKENIHNCSNIVGRKELDVRDHKEEKTARGLLRKIKNFFKSLWKADIKYKKNELIQRQPNLLSSTDVKNTIEKLDLLNDNIICIFIEKSEYKSVTNSSFERNEYKSFSPQESNLLKEGREICCNASDKSLEKKSNIINIITGNSHKNGIKIATTTHRLYELYYNKIIISIYKGIDYISFFNIKNTNFTTKIYFLKMHRKKRGNKLDHG